MIENQLDSKEIADGVYRVGDGEYNCNSYLMIEDGEGILIDPGSVLGFERVFRRVVSILPLEKIKHVIVHHQGPDCCASLPLFEQKGLQAKIVTHEITADFLKYYGATSPFYIVNEEGFELTLSSGRKLQFLVMPYMHFAGAIATYDSETKTFFSNNLFGPFLNREKGLFAEERHIEPYNPRSELMERLLLFDIIRIAPQQGGVIDKDVNIHIKKLQNWDYGDPIEKKLSASGKYLKACNRVVKKLYAIYEPQRVAAVLNREGILLDEQTGLIQDFYGAGRESWNKLFEVAFSEKGIAVLEVLEPLAQTIEEEYGIPIPEIMNSNLLKRGREIRDLSEKYRKLEAFNKNLMDSIGQIQDKFIRDPVTGLFNEMFFLDFMKTAFEGFSDGALFLIDVDHFADIRLNYGTKYRDETIKNLSYLLKREKGETHRMFKLHDSMFAYLIPDTNRNEAIDMAEQLRKVVAKSHMFREKITLSIGLILFNEVGGAEQSQECISEFLYNGAFKRLRIAKTTGNTVCGETTAEQDEIHIKKVLIADTDSLNLDYLRSSLEKEGFKVYTAGDGVEALSISETEKISLVIAELMLPKMDGLLLKENMSFYSDREKIPFILMSHKKDRKTVERALALNVNHYFKKPYMLTEIIGIAKNSLKGGI